MGATVIVKLSVLKKMPRLFIEEEFYLFTQMYYLLDNNQREDSNNHSNKVPDNIFPYKHQIQKLN